MAEKMELHCEYLAKSRFFHAKTGQTYGLDFNFNPLNAELNPICLLLALLGAHHILHVGRIRVKSSIYYS